MARAENVSWADRVRPGGNPRPIPTKGVEGVLHDGHGVKLNQPRPRPLVRVEITLELQPEVRFPEGDVTAPPDSSIAGVGAAELLNAIAVIRERLGGREMDLFLGGPKFGVDQT